MMAINRVHPSGAALVDALSHERVCLVGANVCVKAPPYLPPLDVAEQHARDMAMSLGQRAYPPACPVVRPMVRLCAMFEATMPDRAEEVDHAYLERLNQTIAVYGTHGVHVILDVHQDAFCSSNGGEGLPVWLTASMQNTTRDARLSYITTPERPMLLARFLARVEWLFGKHGGLPPPPLTLANESDPWRAYALGANAGDPRRMNLANPSMRLNNNDGAWNRGTLLFTAQVE